VLSAARKKFELPECVAVRQLGGQRAPWGPALAYTGRARKKIIPSEKFDISGIVADFFHQICSIYRGGFKPHMLRISLQKLM